MMNANRVRLVQAFLAAAALAAPAGAYADNMTLLQPNGRTAIASTAGLDLSREEDAEVMADRIRVAARRVCRPGRTVPTAELRLCRQTAVSQALARLQAPRVTAAMEAGQRVRLG
jgi:UrcA family protein